VFFLVCLPEVMSTDIHKYDKDSVELIGWGSETKTGSASDRLKRVELKVFTMRCGSICLSLFLPICLTVSLPFYLSVFLSNGLSVFLSFCLSVFLFFWLLVFLFFLSICFSVVLFFRLSVFHMPTQDICLNLLNKFVCFSSQRYCDKTLMETTISVRELALKILPQHFQSHVLCAGASIGKQGNEIKLGEVH
jgi:hypothetical protein